MTYASRLTRGLALASLVLGLLGCPPTPPTVSDGGDDAGCAGLVGCECVAGACTVGECLDGSCVDCRRGEAACICRANDTCNTGLRCAAGRCESCPAGEANCPCATGDTCGAGLACSNGTCVADTCTAGTDSCPCRAGDPKCDATLYCDGTTVCRACSNDVVGCPCVSGACTGQTVCDTGSNLCRAPVTCASLRASGACLPNQACVDVNGADATCTPMTCEPQYKWNGVGCVACVSMDCLAEPSCAASTDGGLADQCAAQNRTCVTMGSVSNCGPCVMGFAPDTAGLCQPVPSCGGSTCALDQFCDTSGGTPTCSALPCDAGVAQTSTNACAACTIQCRTPLADGGSVPAPGFSGRIWPFRTNADVCVCETLDNYFPDPGGAALAVPCDADEDGWVNSRADTTVITTDRALRPNARCNIRSTDRVRLTDEYGLSVDVMSCSDGLKKASLMLPDASVPNGGLALYPDGGLAPLPDGGAACSAITRLRLLEAERNDRPGPMNQAPTYGTTGRYLEGNELNALTKACVDTAADYNADGTEDINELQPLSPATNLQRLQAFAYFVELHEAAYENGVLVIRERSRCRDDFPIRYALDGGLEPYNYSTSLSTGGDTPYWRACSREREVFYTQADPSPGYDYAQWGCDDTFGTCPAVPPPHPVLSAPVDEKRVLMRNHGLCRLGGAPPADGIWRGMNHHSQFKCVNVVDDTTASLLKYQRRQNTFGPGTSKLTFNGCVADANCAADGGCSLPVGVGAQTRQPRLTCTPQATGPVGQVGFAAVNYQPYRTVTYPPDDTAVGPNAYPGGGYRGGCVNEDDDPGKYLCPFPQFSLVKADADQNFGRYSCYGRLQNYLWAPDTFDAGVIPISTLIWAPATGNADGGSVLR